jgi:pimeloyl-ACP methyl ester carboxylesterase
MERRTPAPEPPCRLVRFAAGDDVPLAGLLYEPKRRTNRALVFLHGTGGASVFESRRTNLLAGEFTRNGFAYFPFNNRGSGLMKRGGGMAYELIREAVFDIDGALRELRRRGYRDLTLIGHSTGANKIAVYDAREPRNFAKRYVLLAGGDDTGLMIDALGVAGHARAMKRAKEMIRARRGDELIPPSLWHATMNAPMSWRSLYDMGNPDGDYNVFPFIEALRGRRFSRKPRFRHLRKIRKPAFVLYGDRDEFCYGDVAACVAALAEVAPPKMELAVMEDADHGFSGKERELARLIVNWIDAVS